MNSRFQNFVDGLITQDYMLFLGVLFLFLVLIILAVVLRKKLKLAIFLVLLAFSVIIIGPTYGYIKMHEILFKNSVEMLSQQKLSFVEAVVVKGKVTNLSDRDFKECKITASAYKVTSNKYKNYILKLKPFQKMSIVTSDVLQGETKEFKMIVDPFRYQKDYNISLEGDCR